MWLKSLGIDSDQVGPCTLCGAAGDLRKFKEHKGLFFKICEFCQVEENKEWYFVRGRIIRLQKGPRDITISIN